jgi:type II secretory pathway pseudopilin PulG
MMTRMSSRNLGGRASRGFTLVELLTVIAIVIVLMALVVGGYQGIKVRTQRENTMVMMAALEAALKAYYNDWGKFPWKDDTTNDAMATVDFTYNPLRTVSGNEEDKASALLYAALNMRARNGPYFQGAAAQTVERKTGTGSTAMIYTMYADGWGRPIMYGPPKAGATFPLLTSKGPNEFDPVGYITNY